MLNKCKQCPLKSEFFIYFIFDSLNELNVVEMVIEAKL